MGLASALTTALTGLTAAETTIDVVGNNLANANTVGFKASSASFATQFLQTLALGAMPTADSGGTNPRQIGLGTMVADITPNFNQGTIEVSSNPTDIAIQGDGFFIVEGQQNERLYTRNGIFKLNSQNQLVTITGNRVLGYGIDENFQVQETDLQPITIPIGSEAVAKATENVYLEGTLSPTGDIATTASRIQTPILGDGRYSRPEDRLTPGYSPEPNVSSVIPNSQSAGGGLVPGTTYEYRIVFAHGQYIPGPPQPPPAMSEGMYSSIISATVGAGDDALELTNLPTDPTGKYDYIRIYRRTAGDTDFKYVDEIPMGTATYLDTKADAALGPVMDTTLLSGNFTYYVAFEKDGRISRPGPISDPINVLNGRVVLSNLPTGDPAEWNNRYIYRYSPTDTQYHLVAIVNGVTDPNVVLTDSMSDAELLTKPVLDMDGPKIIPSTKLVDVLRRDGSTYEHVFQEGVLEFSGIKGGRTLDKKQLTITSSTTVQDLIDFMVQAMGIQVPTDDPSNPIPKSPPPDPPAEPQTSPGGLVSVDGRIILTGNNGKDNAIDIGMSGMLLRFPDGVTTTVNLPWTTIQQAVGESAVTDFLVYDSLGIPIRVRLTAVLEARDSTKTVYRWFADSPDNDPISGADISVGTGLIYFDGEGNFISATNNKISIERRHVSARSPLEFALDFSKISGLAAKNSTLMVSRQDGSAPGVLTSFIIGEDGLIRGVFSNGVTRDLGQIRLARFANPAGLVQRGQNLYAEGVNSGLPVLGNPGEQGIGTLVAGAVELSNTDIGASLIDLILASSMYRGNTRVISTAQQMLDELLSLRR
ncbi:MAG: flagellar hook-basal body complex protein [Thermogutta sp.]|uniref:flagellar hook-basal body complex protein n=1 Tax=Thermogutta sp. TaxID=1962930 RepID=UPI00199D970A|nr:flagellar hook-basal body complex protein [Thermogutta sp.]MBC7351103.1 flagellar hook-basal body complex protein [Thermogutta sp.]